MIPRLCHPLPGGVVTRGPDNHGGAVDVDLPGANTESHLNRPVRAMYGGVVEKAESSGDGRGLFVRIRPDHGEWDYERYLHLCAIYVAVGERVTKGQYIGGLGNSGSVDPSPENACDAGELVDTPSGPRPLPGTHVHISAHKDGRQIRLPVEQWGSCFSFDDVGLASLGIGVGQLNFNINNIFGRRSELVLLVTLLALAAFLAAMVVL